MISKKDFLGFGIGTFGVGGMMERDPNLDDKPQIEALVYSFERGLNYLDLSFLYAQGLANKIIKKALRTQNREKLFINAKLGDVQKLSEIENQLDEYLGFFNFDYVDSFQIHSPSRLNGVSILETLEEMLRLADKQKTRFISVSNFGPNNLQSAYSVAGDKLFSLENDFSFDVRPCEDVGLLDYCKQKDILFIPYRPIRRHGKGMISNLEYPLLKELSRKYGKTENQILINWYDWKENVYPIIKSTNVTHIDENLGALEFEMGEEDYEKMDKFRVKNENWNDIDWEYKGTGGIKISGLSFVF